MIDITTVKPTQLEMDEETKKDQLTFSCKIAFNGSALEINANVNAGDYKSAAELFLKATAELDEIRNKLRNASPQPTPTQPIND